MESISLQVQGLGAPVTPSDPSFPTVWLNDLRGVDIPEEGEIRFRYSRVRKTETETKHDETCSYELTLKAITDICDCGEEEEDGKENMDRLMEDLKDEDMVDESEDDNPAKY